MCALDWVVRNSDQYGFDLENLVVAGVSAGGRLSLTTGILGSTPGHDCYPKELGIRNKLLSLQGATHTGFTDAKFQQAFEAMLTFVDAK